MLGLKEDLHREQSALLSVLRKQVPRRRPMWLMRQAGRYLPEYRAVRERAGSFLDLCYNPELAAEVTLQPLRRYDLDAAILFADILVVPHAMGLPLKFAEGEGPILGTVRSVADVGALRGVEAAWEIGQVCQTVTATRSLLGHEKALIGFCGGPWTVASYMVEGGGSDRILARVAAYKREDWFVELIDRLVVASVDYLNAQIAAGADAVQVFDSWAGDLIGSEFEEFVLRPLGRIVGGVKAVHPHAPVILFARGAGAKQQLVAGIPGVDGIGIETEMDLPSLSVDVAVQGNLDPVCLLAGAEVAARETLRICRSVPKDRHIFNLGHGIRVGTEPGTVEAVVNAVRSLDG